jgi:riboflavin kinase / FMN adenylyltransferase
MKIFESLDIAETFPNAVLTIGNYDGLHLGHKKIIEQVKERARAISGTSMLMTFDPHPLSILRPDNHLGLITPPEVKKRLIEEMGIDVLLVVPYTAEFGAISPESFIKDILLGKVGIKGLIVGYDFRFGKGGRGDVGMLKAFSEIYDFFFDVVEAITLDGEKIGSNRIRKLLIEGDVKKAEHFLGRPYAVMGTVGSGQGRGKGIGFPTINLQTNFEIMPKEGVYVSEVEVDGFRHPSVTNIGRNPTFDGSVLTIETFLLDFSGDLYGRPVTLYFRQRIRDEVKFESVEQLVDRIKQDVAVAKSYFRLSQTDQHVVES